MDALEINNCGTVSVLVTFLNFFESLFSAVAFAEGNYKICALPDGSLESSCVWQSTPAPASNYTFINLPADIYSFIVKASSCRGESSSVASASIPVAGPGIPDASSATVSILYRLPCDTLRNLFISWAGFFGASSYLICLKTAKLGPCDVIDTEVTNNDIIYNVSSSDFGKTFYAEVIGKNCVGESNAVENEKTVNPNNTPDISNAIVDLSVSVSILAPCSYVLTATYSGFDSVENYKVCFRDTDPGGSAFDCTGGTESTESVNTTTVNSTVQAGFTYVQVAPVSCGQTGDAITEYVDLDIISTPAVGTVLSSFGFLEDPGDSNKCKAKLIANWYGFFDHYTFFSGS